MTIFQYDKDILARYPALTSAIVVGSGLTNGATPAALQAEYLAEQAASNQRLGDTSFGEVPSLAAWRSAFRQFGVEPTKYRCAAEALLRRLRKSGDIPFINTLVDIGNLVSIRYGLPVAVIDREAVSGTITIHFADGSETYVELGQEAVIHPEVGEVVFTDETKTILARRWCWRQSESSAATENTANILVTIEAQHAGSRDDVEAAARDLVDLLKRYAGGRAEYSLLDVEKRAV